jgi:hypothetical protein
MIASGAQITEVFTRQPQAAGIVSEQGDGWAPDLKVKAYRSNIRTMAAKGLRMCASDCTDEPKNIILTPRS